MAMLSVSVFQPLSLYFPIFLPASALFHPVSFSVFWFFALLYPVKGITRIGLWHFPLNINHVILSMTNVSVNGILEWN